MQTSSVPKFEQFERYLSKINIIPSLYEDYEAVFFLQRSIIDKKIEMETGYSQIVKDILLINSNYLIPAK